MSNLASSIDIHGVTLSISALAFLWLALAAPRLPVPWSGRWRTRPWVLPSDGLAGWPRPDADGEDPRARTERMLGGQLRHPAWGGNGLRDLTPTMLNAILVLGAAVADPEHVDEATSALMSRALLDPTFQRENGLPDSRVLDVIDEAAGRHAWWDCVAMELMRRAREAGSWVTPHDLRFLADEEPALLAALSSGPGGTVSPDGAGVLAQHMAETAARTPIPMPCVRAAVNPIFSRLVSCDRK